MVLPCASVMVIVVLLNDEFTCAMPDAMFLRSRRRTRVASFAISDLSRDINAAVLPAATPKKTNGKWSVADRGYPRSARRHSLLALNYFFLPAMALAGPLRVRALVCVRWPRTGRPRRWRRPR